MLCPPWHVRWLQGDPVYTKRLPYRAIREGHQVKGHVALYDNPGASMPVLLSCVQRISKYGKEFSALKGDVFEVDQVQLECLEEWLDELQPPESKLFFLFDTIQDLSDSLSVGQVYVVLGGGAWLIEDTRQSQPVRSRRPTDDFAFLWIEGASILKDALRGDRADEYIRFLQASLLSEEYQSILPKADPYGASPVRASTIKEILLKAPMKETGAKKEPRQQRNSTFQETAEIFAQYDRLHDRIKVRRTPTHLAEWMNCWGRIRNDFCRSRH